jgi:hypothetical protein
MEVLDARRLRQLEAENNKLKKLWSKPTWTGLLGSPRDGYRHPPEADAMT